MKNSAKPYSPRDVEEKIYRRWERAGAFAPSALPRRGRSTFSVVIPPPNVTGSLHLGHALNSAMQDALVRYHRMRGDATVWVPGTDHAGIATQNVVERRLQKEGKTRHDLGREQFVARVWEWKQQYGKTITGQLKRLGVSCDWSRERFTMDERYVRAVQEAFIHYAQKGLIYRGERIVNWCPRCTSSISDLEVKHEEREGHLYTIAYKRADGSGELHVTTTRPETLLGDTAVAVHPSDTRYQNVSGGAVRVPLTDRDVPVLADHAVDPTFGTGVLKVTPAHDHADWDIGQRHKLEVLNVISEDGRMTDAAGKRYAGLTVERARARVLEDLRAQRLLIGDPQPMRHSVALCDRCGTVVQPLMSRQWFVKMAPLAGPALDAVRQSHIAFHAPRWRKAYLDWLRRVQDWCVSRQLWWGHRLPVWYCTRRETGNRARGTAEAHTVFSATMPKRCPKCGGTAFAQDPDVLDTWFSSALWPFAVFGWPESTEDLRRFYPTNVLATAHELMALWVARMVFSGLEFMDGKKYLPAKHYRKTTLKQRVPFRHVLIHPTVLNSRGQRMSKSLGTGVDPLDLIAEYGADATRFGLLAQTQVNQQALKFDDNAVRTGRNVVNKLWNIGKFLRKQDRARGKGASRRTPIDAWMLSRLDAVTRELTKALEQFRCGDAVRALHAFLWDDLADWYVEAGKVPGMTSKAVRRQVFTTLLMLLHPFLPFVTEELWRQFGLPGLLITAPWPRQRAGRAGPREVADLFALVRDLRSMRSVLGVPPSLRLPVHIRARPRLRVLLPVVARLARVDFPHAPPAGGGVAVTRTSDFTVLLPRRVLKGLALTERVQALEREAASRKEEVRRRRERVKAMVKRAPKDALRKQRALLQDATVAHAQAADAVALLRKVMSLSNHAVEKRLREEPPPRSG